MHLKKLAFGFILGFVVVGLSACGEGNEGGGGGQNATNFTRFTRNLVQSKPGGAPKSINARNFNHLGRDNPDVFSGVDFGDQGATTIATRACDNDPGCNPGIHGPR